MPYWPAPILPLAPGGLGNLLEGNYIGTLADGATALANGDDGVFITSFPGETAANNTVAGNVTVVSYSLTMTANVQYTVEFFVSPTADPSGFGQGKTFVGSASVSPSTSGAFPEQANLSGDFTGQFVTATATGASGNTSELSNAVQVSASV